jgi:deoxyribodipyrimidine photo-lyase
MILKAYLSKWLELLIPVNLIHEPWKLNPIEQQFYNCEIGKDYRTDCKYRRNRKYTSDIVWSFQERRRVKKKRILKNMFLTQRRKRQNHNDTILKKAKWENHNGQL